MCILLAFSGLLPARHAKVSASLAIRNEQGQVRGALANLRCMLAFPRSEMNQHASQRSGG